jgi:8-oxo-dGTP pyrophosphatase MutT (NUDIX family)
MNKHQPGGEAVICSLVAKMHNKNLGLFVRQPDWVDAQTGVNDPRVKFCGGRVEAGESREEALVREVLEETGYTIPHRRDATGKLVLGDATAKPYRLASRVLKGAGGEDHLQHFYLIDVVDVRELIELDQKLRKEDDEETIETMLLPLDEAVRRNDFLLPQMPLVQILYDALAAA